MSAMVPIASRSRVAVEQINAVPLNGAFQCGDQLKGNADTGKVLIRRGQSGLCGFYDRTGSGKLRLRAVVVGDYNVNAECSGMPNLGNRGDSHCQR